MDFGIRSEINHQEDLGKISKYKKTNLNGLDFSIFKRMPNPSTFCAASGVANSQHPLLDVLITSKGSSYTSSIGRR